MLKKLALFALLLGVFFVTFWFSFVRTIHSGTVRVPEVTGMPLEDARKVLAQNNLEFVLDSGLANYADETRPGSVVRQDPRGGSTIKQGNAVRLGISLGPARMVLPALVGKTIQESELTLKGQSLSPGVFASLAWSGAEPGRVVAQYPAPNALVPPTVQVDLLLAAGTSARTYLMPDCAGKPADRVRQEFLQRGFRLEKMRELSLAHYQEGVVMAQTPPAGFRLAQGDAVVLTVNRRSI
jgi:serine/threonine-protein kinase